MRTTLLFTAIFVCYAIASELEYRDIENIRHARYAKCMDQMQHVAITDSEIQSIIWLCEERTGYVSNDNP